MIAGPTKIKLARKGGRVSGKLCDKQSRLFGEPAVAAGLDAALALPFPKCRAEAICQ
jgi:hypothetical protein